MYEHQMTEYSSKKKRDDNIRASERATALERGQGETREQRIEKKMRAHFHNKQAKLGEIARIKKK